MAIIAVGAVLLECAENGRDTLTLPRETVISLLKPDYDTIHAVLVAAGLT